jgi:hypothetical protein
VAAARPSADSRAFVQLLSPGGAGHRLVACPPLNAALELFSRCKRCASWMPNDPDDLPHAPARAERRRKSVGGGDSLAVSATAVTNRVRDYWDVACHLPTDCAGHGGSALRWGQRIQGVCGLSMRTQAGAPRPDEAARPGTLRIRRPGPRKSHSLGGLKLCMGWVQHSSSQNRAICERHHQKHAKCAYRVARPGLPTRPGRTRGDGETSAGATRFGSRPRR